MSSFYVSTPIYYVNGAPHIGHAYTTIVADAFARHYRQRGRDVFFLTGTDEHGLKVQRAAEEQGLSPQELVDQNSEHFRELFDELELTHDRFVRTTEDEHERLARTMVERMRAAGDVYLDEYEGWYSVSDETYYDDSEVDDGRAIATGSEVEWVEEESYFFELSAYEDELLAWYDEVEGAVAPDERLNEVRTFVEGGLNDLSITRTTFDWGIEMPGDPDHVLYVWVDALTNYLTGVGGWDWFRPESREARESSGRQMGFSPTFEQFWPCDVHLIGKDILRHHAVYWPAFLMSAGVELPEQIFAHGWWTVEGEKMSKSKGNWVDAFDLADDYELDVLRYFLLREIPLGNDGNYAKSRIVERNDAELADNLGNLVNRTTGMVEDFLGGEIVDREPESGTPDEQLVERARDVRRRVEESMDRRESDRALEAALDLSSELNNYLQRTTPWQLAGEDHKRDRLEQVLYQTLEGIRWVAVMTHAFIPDASATILEALAAGAGRAPSFDSLTWGGLEAGEIDQPEVLFEKLDTPDEQKELGADDPSPKAPDAPEDADDSETSDHEETDVSDDLMSFSDFQDFEFRAGRIDAADPIEGADKLLELTVDVGEEDPRTVVAGVAESFDPADLEGRVCPFVTNLEPASLFGIDSEAMLLAAEVAEGDFELPTFDGDVEPGTAVE